MLVMSWVYLLILVLVSWVVHSWSFAWAVLAGGIISIVSFHISQRDVKAFMDSLVSGEAGVGENGKRKKSKKGFILKFWLRLFLIGIVLFFLIKSTEVNVFGLILGLATVVFTITISAVMVIWKYYFSRR